MLLRIYALYGTFTPGVGGYMSDVALVQGRHRDVALALQRLC